MIENYPVFVNVGHRSFRGVCNLIVKNLRPPGNMALAACLRFMATCMPADLDMTSTSGPFLRPGKHDYVSIIVGVRRCSPSAERVRHDGNNVSTALLSAYGHDLGSATAKFGSGVCRGGSLPLGCIVGSSTDPCLARARRCRHLNMLKSPMARRGSYVAAQWLRP